jgi:hypothetical protein
VTTSPHRHQEHKGNPAELGGRSRRSDDVSFFQI